MLDEGEREGDTPRSRKIKGFSTTVAESQMSILMSIDTSSRTAGGSTAFGLKQKLE